MSRVNFFFDGNRNLTADRIPYEDLVLLSRRCFYPENGNVEFSCLRTTANILSRNDEDFIRGITENKQFYK
jgi:hypothetical protein